MKAEVAVQLLSGNRLLAQGALDAGCRFFSGYPITPSSEIYETMMTELPARRTPPAVE
jgi:2-oxoglutarate/2-oxoacid ferredoxin oxidoreductase subunit alpha